MIGHAGGFIQFSDLSVAGKTKPVIDSHVVFAIRTFLGSKRRRCFVLSIRHKETTLPMTCG
jgi:hypothetical protein